MSEGSECPAWEPTEDAVAAKCTVKWVRSRRGTVDAVMYDQRGRSINAINGFARMPGTSSRRKYEKMLKGGCSELSRR